MKRFNIIILVLIAIVVSILFNNLIPTDLQIKVYTLSHLLKKLLMFLIPFLILPFFIRSIIEIKTKGIYLIPFILLMVWISNFIALMIPYALGSYLIPYLGIKNIIITDPTKELLISLYDFNLPELLSITDSMLLGLIIGLIISFFLSPYISKLIDSIYNFSCKFFEKIFIPILPIYIFGTMLKITHEVDFISLLPILGNMLFFIIITQIVYITFLFFIGCEKNFSQTIYSIKNAIPAGIVGFSTMSSLVTMPMTLKAAEKNTKNHKVTKLTISTTVNCHDVGESISLPIIALTIIYITTGNIPTFPNYIWFVFLVSLAQFSGASVPGGSIAIILPFLTSHFGFTDEMSSLMIALSIFMDPIGTANNVMGNSAFVIIVDRLYSRIK